MNPYHKKKRRFLLSPIVTIAGFVAGCVGAWMQHYSTLSVQFDWMQKPGVALTVAGVILFFCGFFWFAFLRMSD